MPIFKDIETIPSTNQSIIDEIHDSVKPPGNIKKQETIDKWMLENFQTEVNKKIHKTGLNGLYGSVACIAWAFDDDEVLATYKEMTEIEAIKNFYQSIEKSSDKHHEFCGHHIAGFDLPFLKHRSIINNIKPPHKLLMAMNAKRWGDLVADTMLMWSQDKDKMVSLDKLCIALGFAGKGDFDGSMVAETWPIDPQKVIDYCIDDVHKVRDVYKRLTFTTEF